MVRQHDWDRDLEDFPIRAEGVASFLRSCRRPRAAEWVLALGTELERARKEVFDLRVQVNRIASELDKLRGSKESLSQIPHTNKSEWE